MGPTPVRYRDHGSAPVTIVVEGAGSCGSGSGASGSGGSGSGSGSGSGAITSCCPSGLPTTLFLTLSGGCSCINGSYELEWNGTNNWNLVDVSGVCSSTQLSILFRCFDGEWLLQISCVRAAGTTSLEWTSSPTCTLPIDMGSAVPSNTGLGPHCCLFVESVSATITE